MPDSITTHACDGVAFSAQLNDLPASPCHAPFVARIIAQARPSLTTWGVAPGEKKITSARAGDRNLADVTYHIDFF